LKNKISHWFWILALISAFCFDQLFWEKTIGINFPIIFLLAILGGLIPLWKNKVRIPWMSYLLLVPILFFSAMTAVRAEPFTTFTNVMITLGAGILFAITLRSGAWMKLNTRQHLAGLMNFLLNSFAGGIRYFQNLRKVNGQNGSPKDLQPKDAEKSNTDEPQVVTKKTRKHLVPYLRGVFLALPILLILALLLASADPIFNDRLLNLFKWFEMDDLGEYIFRMVYILVLAYVLLSAYYFGAAKSKKLKGKAGRKKLLKPFLGSIEANIILGGVNLLFLFFVILQFAYLFGGETNIHLEGFTYAEYARRGFFELLAVAIISLVLFYGLSLVTKRETKTKRWVFSGLGLFLVVLVGVILASSFTRLSLYESAYGFTRLRTITHVFIIWTSLLLVGVATLEIRQRIDRLAFLLILFVLGFGLTLNLLNMDRFIVKHNVSRATSSEDGETEIILDTGHLFTLSEDAVPPMVELFIDDQLPDALRDDIGGVLACISVASNPNQSTPWPSYHFSRSKASRMLRELSPALEDYSVIEKQGWLHVIVNGETRSCDGYDWFD